VQINIWYDIRFPISKFKTIDSGIRCKEDLTAKVFYGGLLPCDKGDIAE
jgi:hypothetical protein